MHRKAYFFSIDAFVATVVLSAGILLIFYSTSSKLPTEPTTIVSEDVINILSTTRIYQVNDEVYPIIRDLKNRSLITNYQNTLLQQTGEFYVQGLTGVAANFTKNMTGGVVPDKYEYKIIMNKTVIYNTSDTDNFSVILISSKRIVFGTVGKSKSMWGPLQAEVRVWQG